MSSLEEKISVSNVIDKNAINNDVNHKNYAPQDDMELRVAIAQLLNSTHIDDPQRAFQKIKAIIKDMQNKSVNESSNLYGTIAALKKLSLTYNLSLDSLIKLIDRHPNFDINELESIVMTQKGTKSMKKESVEALIRQQVNVILNEFNIPQKKIAPPTPEELADLRAALEKIPSDEPEGDKKQTRKRGSGDEQAGAILQALKDQYGVDMSAAQFQNFDRATKMRWFATAVLSDKDPKFLERTVKAYVSDLEDQAKEDGILDDELANELIELEGLLMDDPSGSPAFSEYLQQEVQDWMESLNDSQLKDIVDRADQFFGDIPGGLMKRSRSGEADYEYQRDMMRRRQTSKDFSGGGDVATGGGSSLDRFKAGAEHPNFPAEK
jgi:hypothetical protein